MTERYKPKECPKCGSHRVGKEKIMGQDTGDWYCGNCKMVWTKHDVDTGNIPPTDN